MNYIAFDSPEGEVLLKAITKLRTPQEVGEFFSDMFTPAEARTFISRWKAVQMLYDGVPYVEIQKETGLSSATIARVSQALQYGTGGYRKLLDRISKRKS